MDYILETSRLGLRAWSEEDLPAMAAINTDTEVMKYFPAVQSEAITLEFIHRNQRMMDEKGYCFFAVEELSSKKFIGFIGITDIPYEASFSPGIEIGWRLAPAFWGRGYATEGARACVDFARNFDSTLYAIAPVINTPSIKVMQKIGMEHAHNFKHPLLVDCPRLEECVLYKTYFSSVYPIS